MVDIVDALVREDVLGEDALGLELIGRAGGEDGSVVEDDLKRNVSAEEMELGREGEQLTA